MDTLGIVILIAALTVIAALVVWVLVTAQEGDLPDKPATNPVLVTPPPDPDPDLKPDAPVLEIPSIADLTESEIAELTAQAALLEDTDKSLSPEDGDQPPVLPSWNDDEGVVKEVD